MILARRRTRPTGELTVTYGGTTHRPENVHHAIWHVGAAFNLDHLRVHVTLPSGLRGTFYSPWTATDFLRYNVPEGS